MQSIGLEIPSSTGDRMLVVQLQVSRSSGVENGAC